MRRPQHLKKSPICFDKTVVFAQLRQNKWEIFSKKVTFSEKLVFNKSCSSSPIFLKCFFSERFNQFSTLKHDFESQNFDFFEFQGQLLQKFLNSFYFMCLSPTLVLTYR